MKPVPKILRALSHLSLEDRFDAILPGITEYPLRMNTIQRYGIYHYSKNDKTVEVVGPYDGIPNFVVVKNQDEKRQLEQTLKKYPHASMQNHLVVGERGILFQRLESEYGGKIRISFEEGIFFMDGYVYEQNNEQRGLEEDEKPRGARINDNYWACIGQPSPAWKDAVKRMIEYFLDYDLLIPGDLKIIYSSDRCRKEVLQVFDKLKLKRR